MLGFPLDSWTYTQWQQQLHHPFLNLMSDICSHQQWNCVSSFCIFSDIYLFFIWFNGIIFLVLVLVLVLLEEWNPFPCFYSNISDIPSLNIIQESISWVKHASYKQIFLPIFLQWKMRSFFLMVVRSSMKIGIHFCWFPTDDVC